MKTSNSYLAKILGLGLIFCLVGCLPDSMSKWYADSGQNVDVDPTEEADDGGDTPEPADDADDPENQKDADNVTSNIYPRFLSYTNRYLIAVESSADFTYGSYVSSNKLEDGATNYCTKGATSTAASAGAEETTTASGAETSFRGRVEEVIVEDDEVYEVTRHYLLVRAECGSLGAGLAPLDNHYNYISPVTMTVPWPAALSNDDDLNPAENKIFSGLLSTPLSYYRPLPVNLILTYGSTEHFPVLQKETFGDAGQFVRYIREEISDNLAKEMVVSKVVRQQVGEDGGDPVYNYRYFGFVTAEQIIRGKSTAETAADVDGYSCSASSKPYVCLRPIAAKVNGIAVDLASEDYNFVQNGGPIEQLNSATVQLTLDGGPGGILDPYYMPGDDISTADNEAVGVISKKDDDSSNVFVNVEPGKVFKTGNITMNINPFGVPVEDDVEDGPGAEGINPHYDAAIHKKATVNTVINNRFFPLYVGEPFTIESQLGQWLPADTTSLTYAIIPRTIGKTFSEDLSKKDLLDAGIALDTNTGFLYGVPTKPIDRGVVTIKATYKVAAGDKAAEKTYSSYYSFEIRVYNTMEVVLAQSGGANEQPSSYYFHKEGAGNTLRKCRITEDQILSDADPTRVEMKHTNFRDIMCYLEGEERDLEHFGYTLNVNVGPGLCQFYHKAPAFNLLWKPMQSYKDETYYIVKNDEGICVNDPEEGTIIVNAGEGHPEIKVNCYRESEKDGKKGLYVEAGYYIRVTDKAGKPCYIKKGDAENVPPMCYGNYAEYLDLGTEHNGPSCDQGSYKTKTITIEKDDEHECKLTEEKIPAKVDCKKQHQGDPDNCFNMSVLKSSKIEGDLFGLVVPSIGGNLGSSDPLFVTAAAEKVFGAGNSLRSQVNFVGTNSCVHVGAEYAVGGDIPFNNFIYFREGWKKYFQEYSYFELHIMDTLWTDPFRYGNPFHTLKCLNAAEETMANIDVVVREWDRHFPANYHLDYLQPDVKEALVRGNAPDNVNYDGSYTWASLKHEDWRLFKTGKNQDVWGERFNDHPTWDNKTLQDSQEMISFKLFENAADDVEPLYSGCGGKGRGYYIDGESQKHYDLDDPPVLKIPVDVPSLFAAGAPNGYDSLFANKRNLGYCSTGLCVGYGGTECPGKPGVMINEYTCRLYTDDTYDNYKIGDDHNSNNYLSFTGWSEPQIKDTHNNLYHFELCEGGSKDDSTTKGCTIDGNFWNNRMGEPGSGVPAP